MNRTTPADRDRAQRRVRAITMATAAGAGILTLGGAAAAAGTFAGRTVSSATNQAIPTQDPGLQQPPQVPGGDNGGGVNGPPIVSGGS